MATSNISKKTLGYVKSVAEATEYDVVKKLIFKMDAKNIDEINELYNNLYNSSIADNIVDTVIDKKIDKLWSFIDNLSEEAAEKLEWVTEVYPKCKYLNIYMKEKDRFK